jgi:hypothetical protein
MQCHKHLPFLKGVTVIFPYSLSKVSTCTTNTAIIGP